MTKFAGIIQIDRIENDMIVDMGLVGMCANNESIFTFCKAHGKLTPEAICFLRRDLSRNKSLT